MKKKLLSVLMAGALVATSSVNAFATGKDYVVSEGEGQDAQIEVIGNIADEQNQVVPGTISVTVPTTTAFTVDKDGKLTAPDINIKSDGEEAVEVIAYSFKDTTKGSKITVVSESDARQSNAERTKVSLNLQGNENTVALMSEEGSSKGIYNLDGSAAQENAVIGTVKASQPLSLKLTGYAGTANDSLTEAVSDNFTLVLKLKKSR
ncbi:hypothetical protein [Clostridium sp.]|uniref:hypothetical protein n=1 Tax=Clostridium sp. TaxID=1506 RepID=UPI0026159707|nr:hypothetical protein [Clostridium sp.]